MITCSLAKPEATLDQIRKMYPKLNATDSSLVATALVLSGRYAYLGYNGETFSWPEDIERMARTILPEVLIIGETITEANKKNAKSGDEPEYPEASINLVPNFNKAEEFLKERDDLSSLISKLLEEGVEYSYSPNDIGWQWALEKVNWNVLSDGKVGRRVKFNIQFSDNSVAVEAGSNAKKKKAKKKAAATA